MKQDVPSVTAAITGQAFGDTEGVNLETAADQGGATAVCTRGTGFGALLSGAGDRAAAGAGFTEDEDRPGAGKAVVLSYGLWHSLFREDPGILGKPILLKGAPYTVVGVMPRGAQMPHPADVWTPLMPDDPHGVCAGNNCLILMRLKPGATWEQVRAQLAHMPPPRNDDLSKVTSGIFRASCRAMRRAG